eukprot:g10269.t1
MGLPLWGYLVLAGDVAILLRGIFYIWRWIAQRPTKKEAKDEKEAGRIGFESEHQKAMFDKWTENKKAQYKKWKLKTQLKAKAAQSARKQKQQQASKAMLNDYAKVRKWFEEDAAMRDGRAFIRNILSEDFCQDS